MENFELENGIQKSDKSILFMKRLLLITTIIFCIAFCVIGIVFWANSQETDYLYGYGSITKTNGLYVGLGFAFSLGGTILSILAYNVALFILWVAFDIKLIRNKLYNVSSTEHLQKFSQNSLDNDINY